MDPQSMFHPTVVPDPSVGCHLENVVRGGDLLREGQPQRQSLKNQDAAAAGQGLRSEESLFSSLAAPQLPVFPTVSP